MITLEVAQGPFLVGVSQQVHSSVPAMTLKSVHTIYLWPRAMQHQGLNMECIVVVFCYARMQAAGNNRSLKCVGLQCHINSSDCRLRKSVKDFPKTKYALISALKHPGRLWLTKLCLQCFIFEASRSKYTISNIRTFSRVSAVELCVFEIWEDFVVLEGESFSRQWTCCGGV